MAVRTTRYALVNDIVTAMYNSFYNSLIRDAHDQRLPARLLFGADHLTPADLRIPVTDLWNHMGGTVTVTQDDVEIDIRVPTAAEIIQALGYNRLHGLKFEDSRTAVSDLLSECARAAELPNLCMVANTPVVPPDVWATYKEAMAQYLPLFERADPGFQARASQIIHRYAAANLLLVAAGTKDDLLTRDRLDAAKKAAKAQERQDILRTLAEEEERLAARVESITKLAEEVTVLLQLYWIYHFEGNVMPGPADEPVWRFLPDVVHNRLRRRRMEREDDPVAPPLPQDPPVEPPPADPGPQLVYEEAMTVAGLFEVAPGDRILSHQRVEPYMEEWGSKKVYRTRFLRRDDYLAIPVRARSGVVVIALVSLNEGHTADYFFRAGRRGDTPEQLHRWVTHAQWPRKRIRENQPDTYIDRVYHETLASWKRGVRRILDEN